MQEKWPIPGSKTDAKVQSLIAAALVADGPSRHALIVDAIAAEREACAEVADGCIWASSAARKIRARGTAE